jgi:hypothetical protein
VTPGEGAMLALFLPAHWYQHTRRTALLPLTLCPTAAMWRGRPAERTEPSTTVARIHPGATGQGQNKSEVAKRSGQNQCGAGVLIQRCQTHNQTQRKACRRGRIGHVDSGARGTCGLFDFSPQATQPGVTHSTPIALARWGEGPIVRDSRIVRWSERYWATPTPKGSSHDKQ